MHHRSVAGFLTGILLAGLAVAQPVQWRVEDGGNGHWYELRTYPTLSFLAARTQILAEGGDFVSITSEAENAFAATFIPRAPAVNGLQHFFIGAVRHNPTACGSDASVFRWLDGSPFTFTKWCPNGNPNCWGEELVIMPANIGFYDCWGDVGMLSSNAPINSVLVEWSADCNNDGIVDKGQILSGELPDANNNGIPDGGPAITSQPIDQNVDVDTPVTFIVEVANDPACTAPVTYQWQRRNPLVADPTAPGAWIDLADGSGFLNTRGSGLIIVRPTPGLATGYRCKMSGGCGGCDPGPGGFISTNTVNFTMACPADFNADGGVDFGDVEEFFSRWENGC